MLKIGFGSCMDSDGSQKFADWLVDVLGIQVFLANGDTPYIEEQFGTGSGDFPNLLWGLVCEKQTLSHTLADYQAHYDMFHAQPGMVKLLANINYYFHTWNDHELPGNDWDHTAGNTQGLCSTQQQVNDVFALCKQSIEYEDATYNHNNLCDLLTATSRVTTQAATGGATYDANNYVARGFKVGLDINGDIVITDPLVEIFSLDTFTSADPDSYPDTGIYGTHGKSLLGVPQADAFMAAINASTATYKIVISPWNMLAESGSLYWDATTVERDYILAYIEANVTGPVIFMAGDAHRGLIHKSVSYEFSGIEASSTNRITRNGNNWPAGYTPSVELPFVTGGADPLGLTGHTSGPVFGYIEANEQRLMFSLRDSETGLVYYQGFFLPGDNTMYRGGDQAIGKR